MIAAIFVALPFLLGFAASTRMRWGQVAGAVYLAALFILTAYHMALHPLWRAPLPSVEASLRAGEPSARICKDVMSELGRAGLVIGRAQAPRTVVRRALWSQLPQQAKDVVVSCIERSSGGRSVEIVEN